MIIWQYSMQGYMDQHIYQFDYFIYDLNMWFIWPKLFPKNENSVIVYSPSCRSKPGVHESIMTQEPAFWLHIHRLFKVYQNINIYKKKKNYTVYKLRSTFGYQSCGSLLVYPFIYVYIFFQCSRKNVFKDIQRVICPEDIINKVVFDMDDLR